MSTIINTETKTRLEWLRGEIVKLVNNGWLRYEGEPTAKGAMQELDDIISTAQEPGAAVQAAPIMAAMTTDQLKDAISQLQDVVVAERNHAADSLRDVIREEAEKTELNMVNAVASARADVLAAVAK